MFARLVREYEWCMLRDRVQRCTRAPDSTVWNMTTQHIGAAGELLVQYRLLKHHVDSARLTTDSGLDLVVYAPARSMAYTVQVKSAVRPTPAGGRGPLALGWTFNPECGADLMAFVDLSTDSVWVFTMSEAVKAARQTLARRHRLYWHLAGEKVNQHSRLIDLRPGSLSSSSKQSRVRLVVA